MSRTRAIPPIPEHVTDEAIRERKARGTDRQAARVLGTKKKEDE